MKVTHRCSLLFDTPASLKKKKRFQIFRSNFVSLAEMTFPKALFICVTVIWIECVPNVGGQIQLLNSSIQVSIKTVTQAFDSWLGPFVNLFTENDKDKRWGHMPCKQVVFQEGNQVKMESLQEDAAANETLSEFQEGESLWNLSTAPAHLQPFTTFCFYFLAGTFNPASYFPDPQLLRNVN